MARQKRKSGKRKSSPSRRAGRPIWVAAILIVLAGAAFWALLHYGVFPRPEGLRHEDIIDLIERTRGAIEAEPSIGECAISRETMPSADSGSHEHVRIELKSDTEIILAEKIIQDLWAGEGLQVIVTYPEHAGYNNGESVYILARSDDHILAATLIRKKAPLTSAAQPVPRTTRTENGPMIAIVIDDIGYNLDAARRLLDIPHDITLSIMPDQPYSQDILAMAERAGREVMMHMPMQPLDYPATDPGYGALLLSMSPAEVEAALNRALDSLPGVAGINNHMGSAFTADENHMGAVMNVLASRGLYFIDSRTTKETAGFLLAQRMGVAAAERRVFLDNSRDEAAIRLKLIELCDKADQDGEAVGIGHPYPETVGVLEQTLPRLAAAGYRVVPASEIVK